MLTLSNEVNPEQVPDLLWKYNTEGLWAANDPYGRTMDWPLAL